MFHKSPRYHSVRFVIIVLALVCLASSATFLTYSHNERATNRPARVPGEFQGRNGVVNYAALAKFGPSFISCPTISVVPDASLPNAQVGIFYSQALTASGATDPSTFAVTSGALAGGWKIIQNAGQSISGAGIDIAGDATWTPHESNRYWYSVASSSDGTKLVAAVWNGQIYTSTDSGLTWTAHGSSRPWYSVASSSDGTKLVAGAGVGQIYTSTDSGLTWTARDSDRVWAGIASSSDGTKLVATANGGQIYTSTDSGVTWTARDSDRAWEGVASSADGTKLVATVSGGQIYTSTDSGLTWTARDSDRKWYSVASSSDGTKLVASLSAGGQIYTSTDSGLNWTPRESSRDWGGVASSSDGVKLAAVAWGGQIYVSTDSGATWTPQDSNRLWTGIASSSDGTKLVAVVMHGQIYTASEIQADDVCTPPPPGMVNWWPAENNANDIVGANNGTLVGTANYAAGRVGQAFSFDGASGWVEAPAGVGDVGSNPFTVDFWMYAESGSTDSIVDLVGKSDPDGLLGWEILSKNDAKIYVAGVDGWHINITSDASATANAWHHIALASTGSLATLYIDGVEKGTSPSSPISSTGNSFRMGYTASSLRSPFKGLLDEVEIYNRELSQSEIQGIYAAGTAGKCTPTPTPTPSPTPPQADLSITKTASPNGSVASGSQITYTLNVNNAGPSAASNVNVNDSIPGGTTFFSVTPSQGSCTPPPGGPNPPLNCALGPINAGGSATITLTVDVTALPGASIWNTATVSSTTSDPDGGNNSASTSNSVAGCDLVVTNTDDTGPHSLRLAIECANANPGLDTITFNIPGAGTHTIQPLSQLPPIFDPVVIDGYSQPGSSQNTLANGDNAVLTIELNGASAGTGANGLMILGGNSTVQGLVINRFNGNGVYVQTGGSNVFKGNFIGTNVTGTSAFGNSRTGLNINATFKNRIGGTTPDARNVISGNESVGISFGNGARDNTVLGNYIGTDVTGTVALGNAIRGVDIEESPSNTIGGSTAGARNLISGNDGDGVGLFFNPSSGNQVLGNFIGTQVDGVSPLGNTQRGVLIAAGASNNLIGGSSVEAGNTIAFNGREGLAVGSGIGNGIRANAIFSNADLGIELGGDGPTHDDNCDGDTGANNLQNFPVLTSVSGTTVQGTLNSTANMTFVLEFFTNDAGDPSGFGEGQNFVGSTEVTTDANCNASFSFPVVILPSQVVTATATDPNGNTSEFSAWRQLDTDLSITKTDNQTEVAGGSQVTYVITVHNNGHTAVTGATVNDPFPPSLPGVSWICSASMGSCGAASGFGNINNVSVNLLAGGTATFTASATVSSNATGSVSNTATVTAPPGVNDPDQTNNSATDTDTLFAADLSITKTASPSGSVATSSQITYTVTVNNAGPSPAPSVTVNDSIPSGTTFSSFTTSQGSCTAPPLGGTNPPLNCSLGTISSGGSVTITLTVDVTVLPGATISNTATVSSTTSDPDAGNNSASASNSVSGCDLVVTNTNDSGAHSLRLAIQCANANPGLETITFNIPGGGVHTIQPLSILPAITDPVIIDGYSQPGSSPNTLAIGDNAVLQIEINGSLAGHFNGLTINVGGAGSTLKGLVINRVGDAGIRLNGGGNRIEGNFIGTNASGTAALGNGSHGVDLNSSSNVIGGTASASRNIISGNNSTGVSLAFNGNVVQANSVQGNYIGTNAGGTSALPNNNQGVSIGGSSTSGNLIGGTSAGAGNVISGNATEGLQITGSGGGGGPTGNLVQGNLIGTDVSGTAAIPNGLRGIFIGNGASSNTIGGTGAAARNVISANNNFGIFITLSGSNVVQGNYIGTNASGTLALGNKSAGLSISSGANNAIGGTAAGAGNVISGNSIGGINISGSTSSGTLVQGNFIGTDVTGTVRVANLGGSGVSISGGANNSLIGGTAAGARNIISGNSSFGVLISSGANLNQVQGNYIGTDVTGTFAITNGSSGVLLLGASGPLTTSNLIGGSAAGAGNVISGNGASGVVIQSAGSNSNLVQGNFIGTDVTGTVALGNTTFGVSITNAAVNNVIGGTAPGARNIISGNKQYGVIISLATASGNLVQGNFIGTDISGAVQVANGFAGVNLNAAANNTIGGSIAAARNIISGNGVGTTNFSLASGVVIQNGAVNNQVQGNYIGTDVSGNVGLGNVGNGVFIASASNNNLVAGNVVSANGLVPVPPFAGVVITQSSTGNRVQANYIGTDAGGIAPLGNGGNGVLVGQTAFGASNNIIGGVSSGSGNVIAFNGSAGVTIFNAASVGNAIQQNSVFSNGTLGIDLAFNGVTLNDGCDTDSGPNNLQNFPVLTSVCQTVNLATIQGTLNSAPGTTFTIEFFANAGCDPSGFGEGQTYLGSMQVTTDNDCTASFTFTGALPSGQPFITATATDPAGNTSEFSACQTSADSDGDGTPDCQDACPTDPTKIAPGACGCGVPDTDSDNDGTPDCLDACPTDPNKIAPGVCGCGVADTDSDGDGIPNCQDNCPATANPDQRDTNGDGVGDVCTPFQFPSGGSFVIGDQVSLANGATVYFWGSQWSQNNPMTGGSGPNAFKGFENGNASPTCGNTWTTQPGNSSNPPATVPQFMAVIVSSSVVKNGSTITGNVKKIIVVQTNPGYGPSPGHAGTGRVVAIICSSP